MLRTRAVSTQVLVDYDYESKSNAFSPPVLNLEYSGGTEAIGLPAVGHGAEGGAAHVEVRLLGAYAIRAGVRDDDGHWTNGAGAVAYALDL